MPQLDPARLASRNGSDGRISEIPSLANAREKVRSAKRRGRYGVGALFHVGEADFGVSGKEGPTDPGAVNPAKSLFFSRELRDWQPHVQEERQCISCDKNARGQARFVRRIHRLSTVELLSTGGKCRQSYRHIFAS